MADREERNYFGFIVCVADDSGHPSDKNNEAKIVSFLPLTY